MEPLDNLLEGAPRFRTARVAVHHRADWDVYLPELERFASNPAIAEMFGRLRDRPPRGVHEHVWRVWIERPFLRRVEEFTSPSDTDPFTTAGMSETIEWWWTPAEGRVHVKDRDISGGIGMLTTDGGRDLTAQELRETDARLPLFRIDVHPMVGELLDPRKSLLQPGAEFEIVGPDELLGRRATRIRMTLADWNTRTPITSENLWVADDYDLVVDDATRIILRLACRAEGEEFSVREMTDVAFDEPIDPSIWEPPPDVPRRGPGPLPNIAGALKRRSRGRRR